MKSLIALLLLTIFSQFSFGQACGIYRIEYIGTITSDTFNIVGVKLPTTQYLHGFESDTSPYAFISIELAGGKFKEEISSHLTTPYRDKTIFLSFLKSVSPFLKIKVLMFKNDVLEWTSIEIPWDTILISTIEDGNFGTLFQFNLGDLEL